MQNGIFLGIAWDISDGWQGETVDSQENKRTLSGGIF
jgi:hypothetical protein